MASPAKTAKKKRKAKRIKLAKNRTKKTRVKLRKVSSTNKLVREGMAR